MELKVILSSILNCGCADVDFIVELEKSFESEFDWSCVVFEQLSANDVIYCILKEAVFKAYASLEGELDIDREELEEKTSIFRNCLDSRLYIKNKNEETESLRSIEEIKEFLLHNYGKL
jgi:hypothetical protein